MCRDVFEKKLQRQSLRKIPAEWRGQILANCRGSNVEGRAQERFWFSTLNHQLSTIFWPHPKAWAGLAAIWIFIFALNFSMRDNSPRIAEKSAPPSPEVLVELKKQQLLFAELMGPRETPDADRQKIFSPKPRSERVEILTA
jgi:hypothetical protein